MTKKHNQVTIYVILKKRFIMAHEDIVLDVPKTVDGILEEMPWLNNGMTVLLLGRLLSGETVEVIMGDYLQLDKETTVLVAKELNDLNEITGPIIKKARSIAAKAFVGSLEKPALTDGVAPVAEPAKASQPGLPPTKVVASAGGAVPAVDDLPRPAYDPFSTEGAGRTSKSVIIDPDEVDEGSREGKKPDPNTDPIEDGSGEVSEVSREKKKQDPNIYTGDRKGKKVYDKAKEAGWTDEQLASLALLMGYEKTPEDHAVKRRTKVNGKELKKAIEDQIKGSTAARKKLIELLESHRDSLEENDKYKILLDSISTMLGQGDSGEALERSKTETVGILQKQAWDSAYNEATKNKLPDEEAKKLAHKAAMKIKNILLDAITLLIATEQKNPTQE